MTIASIHKAGFDWFCYWLIQRVGERVSHLAWFDTYSPPGLADRFNWDALFNRTRALRLRAASTGCSPGISIRCSP